MQNTITINGVNATGVLRDLYGGLTFVDGQEGTFRVDLTELVTLSNAGLSLQQTVIQVDWMDGVSVADVFGTANDSIVFVLPEDWTMTLQSQPYDGYPSYWEIRDENGLQISGDYFIVRAELDNITIINICFTQETKITCAPLDGIQSEPAERRIDELKIGDKVLTIDGTFKPIKWIGSSHVTSNTLEQFPNRRPIIFEPGAIGNSERLRVSPQHRICVSGTNFDDAVADGEKLVPAKFLVNDKNIYVDNSLEPISYYHMMFDQHEIVRSEGTWTESFYPGRYAMSSMEDAVKQEVLFYFPQLEKVDDLCETSEVYSDLARPVLKKREVKSLAFL